MSDIAVLIFVMPHNNVITPYVPCVAMGLYTIYLAIGMFVAYFYNYAVSCGEYIVSGGDKMAKSGG